MLGVSWGEMLVIGVIALIVIGPKDLPVVMRRVGQFVGMIRRMSSEFQRELTKTAGLDEIKSLRNSITAPLRQTTEEIRREFNAINKDGSVKPSGAIKPADPQKQSVVDEIKAQAGITPPAAGATSSATETSPGSAAGEKVASAPAKALSAPAKKTPVKAKRPARAKPVLDSPVVQSDLSDISPLAQPETVAPAEPVKTGPAAKTPRKRKTATPVAEEPAAPSPAPKPRVRKARVKKDEADKA